MNTLLARENMLAFLYDLKQNNNRDWFQNNKQRYDVFKKSYHHLITEILENMISFEPTLSSREPKDCAFRINRDIRFSKDKSPYKTNLGIWIQEGDKKAPLAGYYIHIEENNCFIGGGLYQPLPEELQKIRKEIAYFYHDLEEIIQTETFKKYYGNLNNNPNMALKNPPKGYEKNHPALPYLKLKSFTATHIFDWNLINTTDFVPKIIIPSLIALKPFLNFLNRALKN